MIINDFDPKRESVDGLVPGRLIPNDRALEKVMRRDRKWFAQHPDRSFRARPFDARELPPGMVKAPLYGHAQWTLVCRVFDGVRARVFLSLSVVAAPEDCDRAIRALFEKCGAAAGYHYFSKEHFRPTGRTWPNTGAGYAQ